MCSIPAALPEDLQVITSSFEHWFSTVIKGIRQAYHFLEVILPYCPIKGIFKYSLERHFEGQLLSS